MTFHLLGGQVVEISDYHPKIGCFQQLVIKLENAFRAVCPLAEGPRLPLLYRGLGEEETMEWAGEIFQQGAADRPESPALVRKQHARGTAGGKDVSVDMTGNTAAGLADNRQSGGMDPCKLQFE